MAGLNLYRECDQEGTAGLPELLAPAGTWEHLEAAVKAGADAIYMGGQMFGARANAGNLSQDEVADALHFVHFHGRKLYLTVNTLMKEEELNQQLYGFLVPYYEAGLDGVIVQDLGAASFIRRSFPDMEIHASTQMTITHTEGALAAAKMGMTRVVPARELSLSELKTIKKNTDLELEVFIHGALCFSCSGQCLMSSWYGGRSGNRGRCAQPCRLSYTNDLGQKAHFLSPKDLCSLGRLPALVEAGMDSLKIEGRMKNVEYVAGVTAIYRKYLDLYDRLRRQGQPEAYSVREEDIHILEELYCRGGFTDGYWNRHNGPEMMALHTQKNLGREIGHVCSRKGHRIKVKLMDPVSPRDILVIPVKDDQEIVLTVPSDAGNRDEIVLNVSDPGRIRTRMPVYRRRNEKLCAKIREKIVNRELRYPVTGSISICRGKPSVVRLSSRNVSMIMNGPAAEKAVKRALTVEDVRGQFGKTGATPFVLNDLSVQLEEDSFMPLSSLKKLRQEAYEALRYKTETSGERSLPPKAEKIIPSDSPADKKTVSERIAFVYDQTVLKSCLSEEYYTGICLPMDVWEESEIPPVFGQIKETGKNIYLSLPAVMRHGRDQWEEICTGLPWDGIYVHNINEAYWLGRLKAFHGKRIAAASFYQWNSESLKTAVRVTGIHAFQFPLELDFDEIIIQIPGGIERELLVYGHVPLMISAQCQKKNRNCCDHKNQILALSDPRERKLPVSTHCDYCYNKIWSHSPIDLSGEDRADLSGNIDRLCFDFFRAGKDAPSGIAGRFLQWEKNICNI